MSVRIILSLLLLSSVQSSPDSEDGVSDRAKTLAAFPVAGPFKLILRKFEKCPPEMQGRNIFRLVGAIQKTMEFSEARFNGNFETLETFDDEVEVSRELCSMESWAVGSSKFLLFFMNLDTMHTSVASWTETFGWVPNTFKYNFEQVCSTLNTVFKDAVDFIESHEVDEQQLCPRKTGNFTVKGVPTTYNMKNYIPFRYGRWRVDVVFFRHVEKLGCVRSVLETVPIVELD